MDVRATFDESGLNSGRLLTLWAAGSVCITLVQYLIWQPTGSNYDVISGIFVGPVITDRCVKFGDLRLNLSREIPSEAV